MAVRSSNRTRRALARFDAALEESRDRGGDALSALAGHGRPRRWPWALGAAAAGGLTGAAAVLFLRALGGRDAPGAVPPEQLRAVVDIRPTPTAEIPLGSELPGR